MPTDNQKASRKQEKQVAADNAGRINPGSGNGWRFKNDVRSATVSFECKTTTQDRYSLKLSELQTAHSHALADGKDMAFVIDIRDKRYYTVEHNDWLAMTEEWPANDFAYYDTMTTRASAPLKRIELDVQETQALATKQDPVWRNEIQGRRYVTVRDYTWHMLRGD
ncbi:hypothetical protein ACFYP4_02790 [Streptomyces sp. NPDC005551]|uniref:hypothetical protein n=1 Tax=Streptomyces sp. NPDC005551 TaxID=3364725 RepID=UPI003675F610